MASEADPAREAAAEAGLVYASDDAPGIRRRRRGGGFVYLEPGGRLIRDASTLARIRALVIPPAWKDVWIATSPRGHLQATGRDDRGRKQFRYHDRWREVRDADKFARMADFVVVLPRIRSRVARDLRRHGLTREKVVATIVSLLESTLARIGNEEYARQNGSYGLTTLRSRHVSISGSSMKFVFPGKSGREVHVGVTDRRVARVVKRCEEMPGQMLFQYVDATGTRGVVSSDDVNHYLREITGEDFSAKDFRTWAATVLAAAALRDGARFESDAEAKRNVVVAIDAVARKLGHTRAVCRKSYVHPVVIDSYLDGTLEGTLAARHRATRGLDADEAAIVALLKRSAGARLRKPAR